MFLDADVVLQPDAISVGRAPAAPRPGGLGLASGPGRSRPARWPGSSSPCSSGRGRPPCPWGWPRASPRPEPRRGQRPVPGDDRRGVPGGRGARGGRRLRAGGHRTGPRRQAGRAAGRDVGRQHPGRLPDVRQPRRTCAPGYRKSLWAAVGPRDAPLGVRAAVAAAAVWACCAVAYLVPPTGHAGRARPDRARCSAPPGTPRASPTGPWSPAATGVAGLARQPRAPGVGRGAGWA